jgi:hypothetical protein
LAFLCIIFAVVGCLINRRTQKVKVIKSKTFVFGAIVSTVIVIVSMLFYLINACGDIPMVISDYRNPQPWSNINFSDVIGAIMQLVIVFVFIGLMFIPA